MNNNQYTYNQPPMGQGGMMPPPQMQPRGWRERWMQNYGMGKHSFNRSYEYAIPNWLTSKSIAFFFISMLVCWAVFGYVPAFDLWLVASISVLLFFYGSKTMSKSLEHKKERLFIRNIFIAGVVVRVLWMLYLYFFFNPEYYGTPLGDGADVEWYMPFAKDISRWIARDTTMSLSEIIDMNCSAIDDTGYPMWLGIIYFFVGEDKDIFIPLLLKCILGAYCAVSVYRIAKRHFGQGTARLAAIFITLNPNMIYWCGSMMKEAEMVFLCCLAIDNFDYVLSSGKKYTFRSFLPGILAGLALMFFRAPLGIVMFLAVFAHIVMASHRVMSIGKKIIAGALVFLVLALSMGDRIISQSEHLIESARSDTQKENMEWRSRRENGNEFAKYAGAAVFAPLIFTIPFPTFNAANEGQYLQMQLAGGSYIKNILSFFVIIVLLILLISGEWRRHVFIIAYTVGYLMMLVMSEFAHSGRFHMPVWPMIMLFAAYGIQVAKTNARIRRWLPVVLVIEVVACLAWNWYKLAGRGMI